MTIQDPKLSLYVRNPVYYSSEAVRGVLNKWIWTI